VPINGLKNPWCVLSGMSNNPDEAKDPSAGGLNDSSDLVKSQWRKQSDGPRGGSPEPIVGRCGAKLRNSDPPVFCKRHPITNRNRCRLHGGLTPRGVESANYQGRGYSKDLPARLMERMMDSLDDPDLTSLRSEIALVDARIGELLQNMAEAGTAEAWGVVKEVRTRLRYVVDRPDLPDRETVLDLLTVKLDAAAQVMMDNDNWAEVYGLIDRRRRTAAVELKREESQEHTLRHTQALFFFQQLLIAIHEEVPSPEIKAALATRISKLMNRPPPVALVGPGDLP